MTSAPHSVTFLHTSDLQLGMSRWFLEGEAQARFDAARLATLHRLGEVALEHGAAFIVIAGDVFDSNSLSAQTMGRALEALRALPVPVHLLPGNHDPLVADSVFRLIDVDGVHLLGDSEVVEVAPGVELVGAPLLARTAATDLVRRALEGLEPTDALRIMVGHGQAEARTNEARPDLIDLAYVESRLADGTIDYPPGRHPLRAARGHEWTGVVLRVPRGDGLPGPRHRRWRGDQLG